MALSRDIVLKLLGDSSSAQKALKDAANAADVSVTAYRQAEREQARQTTAVQKASAAQSAAHRQIGLAAAAAGAATLLGLGLSVKAAIDWESAWAGVAKTVEGTPEQMEALEQSLRGLALILPVTHQEIAGVAEAAGQLGVAREDLVAFTATAIALGETTNLSANDAATGLAQLANVLGTSAEDTDRLGSALVELGNNGASTEADILQMAQRIAGAGAVVGLTEGDVLGLASALSSVGIEAEAGGSAISRVLIDMGTAVDEGGAKLEQLAAVAGVTGSEFARLFRDDAASALALFVTGLGNVEEQGGSTFQVLEELGFGEIRVRDALLRASSASDILVDSLALGNQAWEENSALLEEAAKRYATTESQIALARNALVDTGIDIGGTLIPVLLDLSNVLTGVLGWFEKLPGPVQEFVVVLGAVAGVGALAGGGLTVARTKMAEFAAASVAAGGGVSKFGVAARGALGFIGGPFGLALGAAAIGIGFLAKNSGEAEQSIRELTAAIEADSGALGTNTRLAVVNQAQKSGLLDQAEKYGVSLGDLTGAILGESEALATVNGQIDEYIAANDGLSNRHQANRTNAEEFRESITNTTGALREAQAAYEQQQEALGGVAAGEDAAASGADALGSAVGAAAAETELLAEKADELKKVLDELTGTFVNSIEAESGYQEALDGLSETLDEIGTSAVNAAGQIDLNTEAGRRLQDGFIELRDSGNEVIDALIRQGDTQGALAADDRLRQQFIEQANRAGIFGQAAEDLANSILGIPTERRTEITTTAAQAAVGVQDLYNKIQGLNNREIYITTTYTNRYQTDYLSQGVSAGYAYGGELAGSSPNPRADNIMFMGTAGEFVQPVDAVDYYGLPMMEAIRTKSLPRYAGGGEVGSTTGPMISLVQGGADNAWAAELRGLIAQVRQLAQHSHPINIDGRPVAWAINAINDRNRSR